MFKMKWPLFLLSLAGTVALNTGCSKSSTDAASAGVTATAVSAGVIKDINSGQGNDVSSGWVALGTKLYFKAGSSHQLWSASSSTGSATLVKDLGLRDTIGTIYADTRLGTAATRIYFVVNGVQLWTSDGTTAGTSKIVTLDDGSTFSSLSAIGNHLYYQVSSAKVYKSVSGATPVEIYATGTTSMAAAVTFIRGSTYMYMRGNIAATVTTVYSNLASASPTAAAAATTVKAMTATTTFGNSSVIADHLIWQGLTGGTDQWKLFKSVSGAAAVEVYTTGTTSFGAAVTFNPADDSKAYQSWTLAYMYGNGADHIVYSHAITVLATVTCTNVSAGAVGTNATISSSSRVNDHLYYQVTDADGNQNDFKVYKSVSGAAAGTEVYATGTTSFAAAVTFIPGSATMYVKLAAAASDVRSHTGSAAAMSLVRTLPATSTFGNYGVLGDNLYFQGATGGTDQYLVYKSTAGATAYQLYTTGTTSFAQTVSFVPGSATMYIYGNSAADHNVYGQLDSTAVTAAAAVSYTPFTGGTGTLNSGKMVAVGDSFFFHGATTPANDLLVSIAGAKVVAVGDFSPSIDDNYLCNTAYTPVNYSNRLFFVANDGGKGCELWTTTGTSASTAIVNDTYTGYNHSNPSDLTMVGSRIYFTAVDGSATTNRFLFASDSPYTSATKITLTGAAANPNIKHMTAVGDVLYFSASDGTDQALYTHKSTATLATAAAKTATIAVLDAAIARSIVAVGTKAIIRASIGTGTTNWELAVSDSTASTISVANIKEIASGATASSPTLSNVVYGGAKLFFSANDGTNGVEPWVTDGTSSGTVMMKNIYQDSSGAASSNPANWTLVGDKLFFTAVNGSNATNDKELWVASSPFTTDSSILMLTSFTSDSSVGNMYKVGDYLMFTASEDNASTWGMYRTDGTVAGTVRVYGEWGAANKFIAINTYYNTVGSRLYFGLDSAAAYGATGKELWTSDMTTTGTQMIRDINYGTGDAFSDSSNFSVVGSNFIFSAVNGSNQGEIWAASGTSASLVKNINPSDTTGATAPTYLGNTASAAYYFADDGVKGKTLYIVQ